MIRNFVADVWYSRLCDIKFGCMSRLSSMSLIPNFSVIKGSICQACVQATTSYATQGCRWEAHNIIRTHIHYDICEVNGVLTKEENDTLYVR